MTDVLGRALAGAKATQAENGAHKAPEGTVLTVYVAHGGSTLTVGKVATVKLEHGVVELGTTKGEAVFVREADVLGVMVAGTPESPAGGKKAGFL